MKLIQEDKVNLASEKSKLSPCAVLIKKFYTLIHLFHKMLGLEGIFVSEVSSSTLASFDH